MNILIKSGEKFYFQLSAEAPYLGRLLVNDSPVEKSFNEHWYISDEEPNSVTVVTVTSRESGWVVKEMYQHLPIEKSYPAGHFEVDEDGEFPDEARLYERTYECDENQETTEIVWDKVIEDDVDEPVIFTGRDTPYFSDKIVKINPQASLAASALFPDILLPSKPSALSGDSLYKIIREHIKANINPKYAKIDSDYDFCFRVKKLLAINPETRTYDANLLYRSKRVKMVKYVVTNRETTVFEMTPPSQQYKGYTPLPGITAKNHAELKSKIDKMLSDLMGVINEPLVSCDHCKGTGVAEPTVVDRSIILTKDTAQA